MSYTIERYPTRLIDVWALADGRRVTVRPVLPQDAELEQALVRALSPASRVQRFLVPIRELPDAWLRRLTEVDYRSHQALIAEAFDGDRALAVAEARYLVEAPGRDAEFAIVVADDWQRRGLATRLLQVLIGQATRSGLDRLFGDVLATNHAMLALARSLGFHVVRHPDGGAQVLRVVRELQPASAAAPSFGASPRAPAAAAAAY